MLSVSITVQQQYPHRIHYKQLFLWSVLAQIDSWLAPPEHSDISLFLIHPSSLSQERVMDGACL